MSDHFTVRLTNVGKMYKLYPSRLANFLDAVGIARWWPNQRVSEFWALRGIDLELARGQRMGIIGRNGAGKSTLLRLITGNYAPTEGEVQVKGQVQALFDVGAGFHPDFTGYENMRASLTYLGLNAQELSAAVEEIAEFTELGPFLGQPFKTYSLGMQARLGFATATAINPDILIVDEVLGAGDAYFASKSNERMKKLVESGSAVLIVSHALSEIIRYCDEAIWIERGRIVRRGPSMEIVSAYEAFIHTLDDRRLKAKNRKVHADKLGSFQHDLYSDTLLITFHFQNSDGAACDVAKILLRKDGQVEDELRVGDVQDSNTSFSAYVIADKDSWSEPRSGSDGFYRSLTIVKGRSIVAASGSVVFYSYGFFGDPGYSLRVRYRCLAPDGLSLTATKNDVIVYSQTPLPTGSPEWVEVDLPLLWASEPPQVSDEKLADSNKAADEQKAHRPKLHWPSEGSLTIQKAFLTGAAGREQSVFSAGSPVTLRMTILAHRDGSCTFIPAATLFRLDGILISNLVGHPLPLAFVQGETQEFRLDIPALNLGDGEYVFSLSIFDGIVSGESRFDLVDRAYQFKVIGNDPLVASSVFQLPGAWQAA